jgi:glycogen phosphorylase
MKELVIYNVIPKLPERVAVLDEIARNIWFSWNLEAIDLFRSVDPNLWEETGHNPLALLGRVSSGRLRELLEDDGFLLEMDRISAELRRYTKDRKPYRFGLETPIDFKIAYFSAEFGLTDCLPIYSGGLGILSGDHVKSASDLCVPLIGVGLLYQKGYFRQYLNVDGWQQETYPDNDFHSLPVSLERDGGGEPLAVDVPIEDRTVKVRIWRIRVGQVPLFMLDTNTVLNRQDDRDITSYLYGGDRRTRLKQEMVLGIGGIRALARLGIRFEVLHMNEGHSAFAILERIRSLREEHQLSVDEAQAALRSGSIFTTHTPVPAGIDIFDRDLVSSVMGQYIQSLGISLDEFMALGAEEIPGSNHQFNMAVLALRNSSRTNGVSELHKTVSRRMWARIWPDVPEVDVPIEAVTNGIHIPSWISNDMATLLDRYLGRRWAEDPDNVKIWERVNRIPDLELWRTHERRRERLVAFARRRLQEQLRGWGMKKMEVQMASDALDPEALTIGFARRFATYKRGGLILKDPDRLARILNHPQRPVQIIFAGKAHPQDNLGKEVIRSIVHLARQPEFCQRIVFIEDYDLNVARYLVQGADIWLNNPLRPLEACGTSGMKAAANGALNMSIMDGWWAEGYAPGVGWAIGAGEEYEDPAYQDQVESQAIYKLLEEAAVPLFYERGRDNLPREWIGMMKRSMQSLAARFNAHRMLEDYIHRFYLPSALDWNRIQDRRFQGARELSAWTRYVRENWPYLRILEKKTENGAAVLVGNSLRVEVVLQTGKLSPRDFTVDIYYGPVDSKAEFLDRMTIPLCDFTQAGNRITFRGEVPCSEVGRFGFRVRVLPHHPLLANSYSLGLVLWG